MLNKEEGLGRRHFDADDRRRVANELSKHSHPLEGQREDNFLYNVVIVMVFHVMCVDKWFRCCVWQAEYIL